MSRWTRYQQNAGTEPDMMRERVAQSGAVLVVEDNGTTRDRIATVLREQGYEVVEAVDGLDAWQKLSGRRFDLILLDLIMPRVDGWQFRAEQLRHPLLASIPPVIVTVRPLVRADRYVLRITDVVQKPFQDRDVLEAIYRARCIHQRLPDGVNPDPGGLLWSRAGAIACAQHAPDAMSDRWRSEGWAPLPVHAAHGRITYRCQYCPGDGSPIVRSRRKVRHRASLPSSRGQHT
jgi:two-component system, chemotaxis family, chemotaxis protein CheY